jgi:hypothetical protein
MVVPIRRIGQKRQWMAARIGSSTMDERGERLGDSSADIENPAAYAEFRTIDRLLLSSSAVTWYRVIPQPDG